MNHIILDLHKVKRANEKAEIFMGHTAQKSSIKSNMVPRLEPDSSLNARLLQLELMDLSDRLVLWPSNVSP